MNEIKFLIFGDGENVETFQIIVRVRKFDFVFLF